MHVPLDKLSVLYDYRQPKISAWIGFCVDNETRISFVSQYVVYLNTYLCFALGKYKHKASLLKLKSRILPASFFSPSNVRYCISSCLKVVLCISLLLLSVSGLFWSPWLSRSLDQPISIECGESVSYRSIEILIIYKDGFSLTFLVFEQRS